MTISPAASAPSMGPAVAMRPPVAAPASLVDAYAAGDPVAPKPNLAWGVPVVVGVTASSACFGALAGFLVRSMGAAGGIPTAIAVSALLGGGAASAIAISGHNNRKEVMHAAAVGVTSGVGGALVGGIAAAFAPYPVAVGAVAAAAAGLAVSGIMAWRNG